MISNNKTVIVIALIVILVLGLFLRANFFSITTVFNRVEITKNTIEVNTASNDIVLYEIEGTVPLIERKLDGKVIKGYTQGDESFREKKGETLFVGIPNGNYTVDIETVSGKISGSAKSTNIEITTVSGDIEMEKVHGTDLEIASVSGTLTLNDINAEEFSAETVSGDINIASYIAEDGDFNTVSGNVNLKSPLESFAYSSVTVSGNTISEIAFDEGSGNELHTNSVSGDVNIKKL